MSNPTLSPEAYIESLQVFTINALMDILPIMAIFITIPIFITVFRTILGSATIDYQHPSNPSSKDEPIRSLPKIDLTKKPKVSPVEVSLSLPEKVQSWQLPEAVAVWHQWEDKLSFVSEHQDLLTFERAHLFETLKNDVFNLVESFHDLGEAEQPNLVDEFIGSLWSAHGKMRDFEEAIKLTKEFHFRQKAERIRHR